MSYEREIALAEKAGLLVHEQKMIAALEQSRGLQYWMMGFARKALRSKLLLDEIERLIRRQLIIESMEQNDWNSCESSKQLGVECHKLEQMMLINNIEGPRA